MFAAPLLFAALVAQAPVASLDAGHSPTDAGVSNVYVGLYLSDVSNFDLKEGRFQADLQVWVKWAGSAEVPPISFDNAEIDSQQELSRESEGEWHSVRWRIQGTFRGTFPLHRFPFDRQQLPVEVSLPRRSGALVPDLASSGMAASFSITGWIYEPYFAARNQSEKISSDFGAIAAEGKPTRIERLTFSVELVRPFAAYVLKFVLPLGVIFLMALLALMLPADRIDVRSGIGVTALLSCVAFHFSQSGTLPDVAYLVAADKLFLGAYVLVVAALIGTVVAFNLSGSRPLAARRMDRLLLVALPIVAAVSVAFLARSVELEEAPEPVAAAPVEARADAPVELHYLLGSMENPAHTSVTSLTRRGPSHDGADGGLVAHLVDVLPSFTNDRVRFLPNGGMRVRWRLRPDLRWSDGSPITAEDLAFSFGVVAREERERIEIVDPLTIDIYMKTRRALFLEESRVLPARYRDTVRDGGATAVTELLKTFPLPVLDGPYVMTAFDAGVSALFVRNPHFAGPRPAFERIHFSVVKDSAARAAIVLDGGAHLTVGLSDEELAPVKGRPEVEAHQDLTGSLFAFWFDLSVKPFDDLRVRQAFAHAIDRPGYLAATGAVEAESFRRSVPGGVPEELRRPHDPVLARALLEDAGVALPLRFTLHAVETGRAESRGAKAREGLFAELREVGFEPEVKTFKGVPDFVSSGATGGVLLHSRAKDHLRFVRLFGRKLSRSTWSENLDPVFDEEVFRLSRLYDQTLFSERREVIERRLERLFLERLPVIPLSTGTARALSRAELKGVSPDGRDSVFWNVETWSYDDAPNADAGASGADAGDEAGESRR